MKNAAFRDVTPYDPCKNRHFRGIIFTMMKRISEQGTTLAVTGNPRTLRREWTRLRRLLVTANAVPSSPILVTLMMDALLSSETLILTKAPTA
jgi:hypothetical protein